MIILYTFLNEEKHQYFLSKFLNYFPEEFRHKVLGFRKWEDTQLSLLGRVLLCHGLDKYYKISELHIELSPNGKPFIKNQNIHFNVSHSKNLVVCIIADFPIGIDIEFLDEKINYLDFQFQMTANELQEIQDAENKIISFYTYWTKKEAVIKAHGEGMMIPLASFEVINNETFIKQEKFYIREFFIDKSYSVHLASNNLKIKNETIFLKYQIPDNIFLK